MKDVFSKVNQKIDNMVDDIFDSNDDDVAEVLEQVSINLGGEGVNINVGGSNGVHVINLGGEEHNVNVDIVGMLLWLFGLLIVGIAGLFLFVDSMMGVHGFFPTNILIISVAAGVALCVIALVRGIIRKRQARELDKIASLVVASELRAISDIVRHSGMPEQKVIDGLRTLASASGSLKLGNDARYLKGAKINLKTMRVTLSDKYTEQANWVCVYCRAKNEAESFVCQSCNAPKKKV